MNYKTITLGCKVNQYETHAVEEKLRERGFSQCPDSEPADVIIVNTCAVTAESGRKSRQAIRKLMGDNPDAVLAVCGCYSQVEPQEISELGARVVHGSGNKEHFVDDIIKALSAEESYMFTDDPFKRREFEELKSGAVTGRTRAMLKIQDGCVNFCTYCIIPYTRGRLRSLPSERCAAQTLELAAAGYKELVVTGIEIASYGVDLSPKCTLADAIEAIAESAGDMRIRLGSLEPTVITEDFCRRLAATGKVCNHFHLSLQSGCDEILNRMNRKYNTEQFFTATENLRKYFPDCGLTADLIVGFPGETEQNHADTLAFIEKCGFSSMHIFPYSIRPGTKAATMPNQLTHVEKSARAATAKAVAERCEQEFFDGCIGKTYAVLFETEHDKKSVGHASNYAQVEVLGENLHGVVENVQITGKSHKNLVGKIV